MFFILQHKQLQGSWGVMYDGGDKSHKLPRIDLFEQKGAKSPVHSLSLEHVKFSDKTYRQPEDHFTLSIKKEKHVFQFESAEDKEDWVHSLCHVSKDLWQQRAKAIETSDFDDSESNMDMSDNLLYDSADKGEKGLLLFVGWLASQQHASVSQGWIWSDKFTCCHTEKEIADQNFLPHSVTVCWHRASQSQCWPYSTRRLAG